MIWFSEINELVAGVFARHWPDAPNLGDITTVKWNDAKPGDVLCGASLARKSPRSVNESA